MQNLPSELRLIITSYLDDKSRRVMRLTNKEWFNRIQYNNFKFYFTTNEQLPHILKRLAQYSWPISVDFKNQKFQATKENCENIAKLTHLTGLRASFYKANPNPLTNLTNLEHVEPSLPMDVMKYFTKLKSILLGSIEEAIKIDLGRFTNLESVAWFIDDEDSAEPHEDKDPLLLLRNALRLTNLQIETPPIMDEKNLTRFTNLKRFSVTHGWKNVNMPYLPNLESLDLRVKDVGSLSSLQQTLTDLTVHCYSLDLPSIATLTNLKKLNLSARSDFILSSPQDWNFLAALTNLENLVVHPYSTGSDYSKSLEFINSKKLISLEYPGDVDMKYIAKFGNQIRSLKVRKIANENNEALQLFVNLTSLRISDCRKEEFPIIETLSKLQDLDIRYNQDPSMTSADVLHLDKLTSLKSLSVSTNFNDIHNHIDEDSLKHVQLKTLYYDWSVDQKFAEKIAAMTSLEYLYLAQTEQLTDSAISLFKNLTNLTCLKMGEVSDKMTGVTLTLLTSLQQLHVSGSYSQFIDSKTLEQRMTRLITARIS